MPYANKKQFFLYESFYAKALQTLLLRFSFIIPVGAIFLNALHI